MKEIFTLHSPKAAEIPLIFDSPHSGTELPADFDYTCDPAHFIQAADLHVADLFVAAPTHGAHLLEAHFPRYYVDLNRADDDIDPKLFTPNRFEKNANETHRTQNQKDTITMNPTARSDAGIGLFWRTIKPGINIYNKALSMDTIPQRLETYYHPYHNTLKTLITHNHEKFGINYHINCHSMPAHTAFLKRPNTIITHSTKPIDFCIGTRDGTTCENGLISQIRRFLTDLGYHVTINDPFKGVELIQRYSAPTHGLNSLQLEINRKLYMDEHTGQKSKNFDTLKNDIDKVIKFLARYAQNKAR